MFLFIYLFILFFFLKEEPLSPHFISTMENKYKAKVASEENLSNLTVLQ